MARSGNVLRSNPNRAAVGFGVLLAGMLALSGCTKDGGLDLPNLGDTTHAAPTHTAPKTEKGLPAGTNIYERYEHGKLFDLCATLGRDVVLGDLNPVPGEPGVFEFLHHQPDLDSALGGACENGAGKDLYAEPRGTTVGAPQL